MTGPDIGGPLTPWHAHTDVCFSPVGAMVEIVSPFGTCPTGTIHIVTAELLHVWTVDNPEGPFSENLDPTWLAHLLAS